MTTRTADPAAEIATAWALEDAEREWTELRDAILAEGGICANADYSHESMPRPLYRVAGNPADDVAWRLGFDRADTMLDLAWRIFDRCAEARRDADRMRHAVDAPPRQRGKLSLDEARAIRDLVAAGESRRAIAEHWGIHVSTVGDIVCERYLKATA